MRVGGAWDISWWLFLRCRVRVGPKWEGVKSWISFVEWFATRFGGEWRLVPEVLKSAKQDRFRNWCTNPTTFLDRRFSWLAFAKIRRDMQAFLLIAWIYIAFWLWPIFQGSFSSPSYVSWDSNKPKGHMTKINVFQGKS